MVLPLPIHLNATKPSEGFCSSYGIVQHHHGEGLAAEAYLKLYCQFRAALGFENLTVSRNGLQLE